MGLCEKHKNIKKNGSHVLQVFTTMESNFNICAQTTWLYLTAWTVHYCDTVSYAEIKDAYLTYTLFIIHGSFESHITLS